ncbi:MAG: sodium:alanine symporter family protein [Cyclobacteriaceae bacterium]|nr:sodium:alanine symporter family protein [Cyclobacteriaceae bacterium]
MYTLNQYLELIDQQIGGSFWFVLLLLGTGLFFTLYMGFPQIRYFKHALKIVRGKYDRDTDEGDTTHFQALATALSGTVGTGNIAGVALAIHLGGPAALFWMIVTAFLGMTTKFVEVTLSHKYREKTTDGTMAGGPMYYMKKANFQLFGIKLNLKWMAIVFAVATVISSFGTGSMPQINTIASSMFSTFGLNKVLVGAVLSVLLALVIIGGIRRIAKVTEKLVPAMAIIYFIGAILVLSYNYDQVIPSIVSVFADVFSGTAAAGGFLGAGFIFAFNRGVNRGLFSNEAGQGSAPIAHASAKAHEPVSEGMVAILEPFIDTIVICFLTGVVLLSSGVWNEKHENVFQLADLEVLEGNYSETREQDVKKLYAHLSSQKKLPLFTGGIEVNNGILLLGDYTLLHARSVAEEVRVFTGIEPYSGTINVRKGRLDDQGGTLKMEGLSLLHSAPLTAVAFTKSIVGDFGKYIISLGLLLFAFSTSISWSYYGDRAMIFLFGSKSVIWYRFAYVAGFFIAAFTDTTIIWTFSGIAIALMTLPNLIGILLLRKELKETVAQYWVDFKNEWKDENP